jgi:hypothetical protein
VGFRHVTLITSMMTGNDRGVNTHLWWLLIIDAYIQYVSVITPLTDMLYLHTSVMRSYFRRVHTKCVCDDSSSQTCADKIRLWWWFTRTKQRMYPILFCRYITKIFTCIESSCTLFSMNLNKHKDTERFSKQLITTEVNYMTLFHKKKKIIVIEE